MSYKLYSPQNQITAGVKIEILAKFIDIPIEVDRISWDKLKTEDFLKKHPLGKVPTLETPEGCIYESGAILRFLARKAGKFYGNTPAETAAIDQWLEFYNTQLSANHPRVFYGTLGYYPVTKEAYEAGKKDYLEVLKVVEAQLNKTSYLAGNEISIADISLLPSIRLALRLWIDEKHRASIPKVVQWNERLHKDHKEIGEFFGKPWLCIRETLPTFETAEKKEEEKKDVKKDDKKKGEGKKKEEKKKEEPKKKEAPKKKKEEEAEEEVVEKKKTNPLDELPKSPFNIDDWKREFFNAPDMKATLKELWPKFDHEGWSVWKVDYIKYEGEGVVGYLTSNLKNGHLRNLDDAFRKYCFATYGVYGDEGNYEIDGIWMWRGTEIPHFWTQHNSFEYFTFKKLDPKNEADQLLTEEYWLKINEGDKVQGRNVFDATWYR